jgi:hypothetical protein
VENPYIGYSIKGNSTDFLCLKYQPAGRNQRWRQAWVDLGVLPTPIAWLESRVGRLDDVEGVPVAVSVLRCAPAVPALDMGLTA